MVETIKESTKRETKLEKEREYWPFCSGQLGRNRGERWKWSKKKFMWKLRWKRNDGSRWKVEQSETLEFKKI